MSRHEPVYTVALYPRPNVAVRPPSVLRDVVWIVSLAVLGGLLCWIVAVLTMLL
jgi:hypothetical protein